MMVDIDINALVSPLLALWLPFVRILSFLHFCPILDQKAFSRKLKIVASLLLSILMTPMLHHPPLIGELFSMKALVLMGEQILWGLLFGMMLQMVFVTLETAGSILSMNMGLSMAVMNDPSSGASTTVISQIIFAMSALLFFSMDCHLLFITILYKGFTFWPMGEAINTASLRNLALSLGWIMSAATLMALPTTFIMLTVQGVFGLLNRISPALNLFSLGFPICMLFGLLCLILLVANVPEHYLNLTNEVLRHLDLLRGQDVVR
ncbi:flagellar biosynthetic protein FliR [Serratia sp. M24T3]|uniref:flagellar biosynthetic protein FliR n=1 Tax=Serratia sp. M24T3 TaxID=932213 RepID=UPI00025BBCB1|nr:flagellar biosynthetic protein FliR [Serratia sp. M24T3]EIC82596.1 flagellar biosynthetic protein FliR [Serratia sp. M24T3]